MKLSPLDPRAVRQTGTPRITTLSRQGMTAVVGGSTRPTTYDIIGRTGVYSIYDAR